MLDRWRASWRQAPAVTTQPQLEALVDLLLLGMHTDRVLSVAEADSLAAALAELPWESGQALSIHLSASQYAQNPSGSGTFVQPSATTVDIHSPPTGYSRNAPGSLSEIAGFFGGGWGCARGTGISQPGADGIGGQGLTIDKTLSH